MSTSYITVISTPGARIAVARSEQEVEIVITGEIDAANHAALRDAVHKARSDGPGRIVIDAAELDFLAVASARELVADGDLRIVNAYGIVKRVLDLIAANGV